MKQSKPSGLTIKTPFWSAFVRTQVILGVLAVLAFFIVLFYLVFHILWIAILATVVGFGVFVALMPRPTTPPSGPDEPVGSVGRPQPTRPVASNRKRQKSGPK